MKTASVRDLRYKFQKIEELLRDGEEIQITQRKRVIARLLPPEPPKRVRMPEFMARMKKTFGDKIIEPSTAELLRKERDEGF